MGHILYYENTDGPKSRIICPYCSLPKSITNSSSANGNFSWSIHNFVRHISTCKTDDGEFVDTATENNDQVDAIDQVAGPEGAVRDDLLVQEPCSNCNSKGNKDSIILVFKQRYQSFFLVDSKIRKLQRELNAIQNKITASHPLKISLCLLNPNIEAIANGELDFQANGIEYKSKF